MPALYGVLLIFSFQFSLLFFDISLTRLHQHYWFTIQYRTSKLKLPQSRPKMETRHPVEGPFGREFLAICNHCGVTTAWSRKTWKFCEQFLLFFEKKRPFIVKFCFEISHLSTLCWNVANFFPTGNRRNRVLFTGPKKFRSLSNCRYCADCAQNLPGPAPNIWLTLFQIWSKSVNFRRSCSRRHQHSLEYGIFNICLRANNY